MVAIIPKKSDQVTIIGQGFVGLPMAIAIARIKVNNNFLFKVEGIEKNDKRGRELKKKVDNHILPISSKDIFLKKEFQKVANKNYFLSLSLDNLKKSDVIIISVGFDFSKRNSIYQLKNLTKKIFKVIKKGALLLIETTLPPKTCEDILVSIAITELKERRLSFNDVAFAYSFERVTPGKNYLKSIINSSRVYSGINKYSKKKCKLFLKKIINYKKYPLIELDNIRDVEATKIFENSYRAVNISLIDEWTKFSNKAKINLNSCLSAIRLRETHKNIRYPGLGVGGYCLTKDPKFLNYSSNKIMNIKNKFPITELALKINQNMFKTSYKFIKSNTASLKGKNILFFGISYKEDVGDIRFSPAIQLVNLLNANGSAVFYYDENVREKINNCKKITNLKLKNFDIILFCQKQDATKSIIKLNLPKKITYFDLNNVLNSSMINFFIKKKYHFFQLGKD